MSSTIKKNPAFLVPQAPAPTQNPSQALPKSTEKTSSTTSTVPSDASPSSEVGLGSVGVESQSKPSALLGHSAPPPVSQGLYRDLRDGVGSDGKSVSSGSTSSGSFLSAGSSRTQARIRSVSLDAMSATPSAGPVADTYQKMLGREPDAAGKSYWDQQVDSQRAQGKSDPEIQAFLEDRFKQSPEYQTREVAKQVYRDVLGREADAEGLRYWTEKGLEVHNSAANQSNTGNVGQVGSPSALPPLDLNKAFSDPNGPLTVAIGHSEGNRTASGGFTGSYNGHTDPGNGVRNMGSFSYQVHQGGASTPEQADRLWLNKMKGELPAYQDAAKKAGMDPANPMLASMFFDTYTQAPAAAVAEGGLRDRMGNIADAMNTKQGPDLLKSLVKERMSSYVNPATGRLEASGFGNSPQRLAQDQARRTIALAKVADPQNKLGLHGLDPASIGREIAAGNWQTPARATASTSPQGQPAPAVPSQDPDETVRNFLTDKFKQSDEYKDKASEGSPPIRLSEPTLPEEWTFATTHAPSMKDVAAGQIMEKGQGGPAVKEMQDRLTQLGFGVQQTGEFGPTTENTLREFQKAHHVQPTGKFGPTTLAALEKAEAAQRPDFSALKKTVEQGRILGEGDRGAAVVDLQRMLTQKGFATEADGKFGPSTAEAVKKFQAANNIIQNGQIGMTTLKALQSAGGGGSQPLPGGGMKLDVPFYKQTDNYTMPDRTCNSSSCAMAAKYLGANISGDDQYLQRVLQYGDTTDHSAQTRALNDYGIKSSFHYNLDFKDLDQSLAAGKPVVIGILHRGSDRNPTGGHMVTVIGKQGNDYIVNDPYGSLHDGYTGAVENGKGAVYTRAQLEARWTADGRGTGWGRIFE